jgi:potassium-transporting ATPase KdpC subunit
MKSMWNNVRMFLWMTFLTGIIYPLLITAIAQLTMKQKADGNFLTSNEKVVGAILIAQKFENDKYFWARPSAIDYNPLPSGGSNLGPTSAALKKTVEERKEKIAKAHSVANDKIPAELLFASGSGLDPHINVSTAYFQIERVAKSRGIESKDIKNLVDHMTTKRSLGFLGEACVNVLLLNKALDDFPQKKRFAMQNILH